MSDKFVQLHDASGNNLYPNVVTIGSKIDDKFIEIEARYPATGNHNFSTNGPFYPTAVVPDGYMALHCGPARTNGFVGSAYVIGEVFGLTGNIGNAMAYWVYYGGTGYINCHVLCVKIDNETPEIPIPRLITPIANGGTGATNVSGALANLGLEIEDITSTVGLTKSSGSTSTQTVSYAYRYGHIVLLKLEMKLSASVSAGSNILVGTLSGLTIVNNQLLNSYYGPNPIFGYLSGNSVTVRVTGSGSVPANATVDVEGLIMVR